MHEFSIMSSALELAEKNTRAAGATQIHRLKVRVGALSGVVPEALRFAFDGLKDQTLAAGAEFEIELVPAVGWCRRRFALRLSALPPGQRPVAARQGNGTGVAGNFVTQK
jgi:hydrogenase nickel insertion protein HypA